MSKQSLYEIMVYITGVTALDVLIHKEQIIVFIA